MGGVKSKKCNEVTRGIWNWCRQNDIWVSTCMMFVRGVDNIEAGTLSCQFNARTKWMLVPSVFKKKKDVMG